MVLVGDESPLGQHTSGRSSQPPSRRSVRAALRTRVTRLRATHPVRVLKWLRAGALTAVLATGLLYLLVSAQADHQIAAARRTQEAIQDLDRAYVTARAADTALAEVSATGQADLIGTGTDFANATARVNTLVTASTQGNAAGKQGLSQIQFVQGQLTTSVQLAEEAAEGYEHSGRAGLDTARETLTRARERDPATGDPIPGTGGLMESLTDLRTLQQSALDRQRDSQWLRPAYVWSLLVGPVAAMLLCVLATGHVTVRHFRRRLSPQLVVALGVTAAVGVTTAALCLHDARRLTADPLVGRPLTMALALSLLMAAGVLAHLSYRPRLAEYRFPRS